MSLRDLPALLSYNRVNDQTAASMSRYAAACTVAASHPKDIIISSDHNNCDMFRTTLHSPAL